MTTRPAHVSVIEPLAPAIDRAKLILFQPFSFEKWVVIGFCAWLALLGESGGGGMHFNFPSGRRGGHAEWEQAKNFVVENLYWIVPVAVAVLLVAIGLGVLFTWLSSRGKFMFLDCVVLNRAEVLAPWQQYRHQGNSLFIFRLIVGLAGFAMLLPFLGAGGFLVYALATKGVEVAFGVAGLILAGLFVLGLIVVLVVIDKLTTDFVVPIMYLRGERVIDAWRILWTTLKANLARFVGFLLFQIVLSLAIGVLVLAVVLLTCCVAGCLLALPYIGTVLLLPILVFDRSYSLLYLAQYGSGFDVWAPPAPTAATPVSP